VPQNRILRRDSAIFAFDPDDPTPVNRYPTYKTVVDHGDRLPTPIEQPQVGHKRKERRNQTER